MGNDAQVTRRGPTGKAAAVHGGYARPSLKARKAAGIVLDSGPGRRREIAARVVALVDTRDRTQLVTTIAGNMRLGDYLPTRTVALAVYTADLATALGVPPDVQATAAAQALHMVTGLALADGLAGPLLLAATGRAFRRASRCSATAPPQSPGAGRAVPAEGRPPGFGADGVGHVDSMVALPALRLESIGQGSPSRQVPASRSAR